jgi:hypothetical protein
MHLPQSFFTSCVHPLELNVEINMKCQVFENIKLMVNIAKYFIYFFLLIIV